jgi:HAAS domain-containing protein
VTIRRDEWLTAVACSLRGPRRRRRRLLSELEGHLEDAAAEERAAGHDAVEADAIALERLGAPAAVAADWNADVHARRSAARLRVVVLAVVAGALLAPVALAQRGTSHPLPAKAPATKVRPERGAVPARAS